VRDEGKCYSLDVDKIHLNTRQAGDAVKVRLAEGESVLDGLLRHGVALAHDCGGKLACVTCRVLVLEGFQSLSMANEDELDMLDRASGSGPGSRLACQATGAGGDLVIEIPPVAAPLAAASLNGGARAIRLTERAARHFAVQLGKRPVAAAVRLAVKHAGCSGFGYRVEYADTVAADDTVFESHSIRVAVDPASLPFVRGTTLDLVQDGLARRLRFDNPNARSMCGCGESFGT
jgi:iron-sulfur cluster assembly protein